MSTRDLSRTPSGHENGRARPFESSSDLGATGLSGRRLRRVLRILQRVFYGRGGGFTCRGCALGHSPGGRLGEARIQQAEVRKAPPQSRSWGIDRHAEREYAHPAVVRALESSATACGATQPCGAGCDRLSNATAARAIIGERMDFHVRRELVAFGYPSPGSRLIRGGSLLGSLSPVVILIPCPNTGVRTGIFKVLRTPF